MQSEPFDTGGNGRSIALVIDDAPETLGLVSNALEQNGMIVLVARSGEEGITLAQRVQPDVVLLDAMMPGMDGFETCKRLKAAPVSLTAPIVFMTGMTDPEHRLLGLRAGGVDYVTKPVMIDELIARITTHVLNARSIASARTALDYTGQSILAFAPDGHLAWGTPGAVRAMAEAEGDPLLDGDMATLRLREWLTQIRVMPISQARVFKAGTLSLACLGHNAGEVVVRLREETSKSGEDILQTAYDLTPREAEVLFWLSHGKTNQDIADILSLSARTVNKHLEQIFLKMGVDNRTSAAVLADRILQNA